MWLITNINNELPLRDLKLVLCAFYNSLISGCYILNLGSYHTNNRIYQFEFRNALVA